MGQSLDSNITLVAEDATSVTLRPGISYVSSAGVGPDTVNSFAVTGNWARSGAVNVTIPYGGGWAMIYGNGINGGADLVVAKAYGATQYVSLNGSLTGIEYWGSGNVIYTPVTGYIVPARAYDVPAAPTGVAATRNSDTSHTINWTLNPTGAAPYGGQNIYRSTDGAGWALITALAPTTASFTDTTTSPDHAYAWYVLAGNDAGAVGSAPTATLYTTPAAPTTPSAVKAGTSIVLSFTLPALFETGFEVYEAQNGGAFALLATVATANLTTYTHASPSALVTHAYTIAAYNGSLISAQSAASNVVQLAAAPAAPTGLGPTTARPAAESVALVWTHNPTDSSTQTYYQTRHRTQPSGTWITDAKTASGTPSLTITPSSAWGAANGTTLEWAVSTWGQDSALQSPWSATSTMVLSTPPTATIASPAAGEVMATSRLTATWAYYDAEGTAQAAWQADLLSGGVVVESKSGSGAAGSVTFARVLPDASAWSVAVKVKDSSGLWSAVDTVAFTVAYPLPPTPTLTATWNADTATVAVAINSPLTGVGEVDATHNDVWRSIDGGPEALIATGVPLSTTLTDYSPTVAGTSAYRVNAVSALPSSASSSVVTVTTPQVGDPPASLWLSGGPGFSQVCRAVSNIAVGSGAGLRDRVLHQFAGRTRPVEFAGVATSRVWQVSTDVIASSLLGEASLPAEWMALALLPGPFLLRTLDVYAFVSVSGIDAQRAIGGALTGVSFSATEVDDA